MNSDKKIYPYELSGLEAAIGYKFKDISYLREAVSHSSYSNEMKTHGNRDVRCNERLEFLGDSILSLISSDYLFKLFPDRPEGELTKIRASVVCERALAGFAQKIELGSYLLFGKGEEHSGGRERKSLLADAFEALLAAMYLDAGKETGLDRVSEFLIPFISAEAIVNAPDEVTYDYKTLLQQIVQSTEGELFEYVLVSEEGPAHERVFEIEARLNSNVIGRGRGGTKREAEQRAAKQAVELFGGK